ncbi:c-type cytochrome [Pedobacter sp.]|uniref:c-type cytochrome n=1 Tax=Pedobacter sp. TaxID=1411316 RepID=UPI003D7F6CAD
MKILKVIALLACVFALLLIAAGTYVKMALPDTGPPPDLKVKRTSENLENGRYLANHVTVCMDCHSKRDWTKFAAPIADVYPGGGGEVFNKQMGFPGTFYSSNITPAALGNWTDGEIFRAVTTGVSKDGRALFSLMASHRFGRMDQDDINDIIVYLRSLKAVDRKIPESQIDFPVNFLINTMPQKASFVEKPKPTDTLRYGAYLVNAAGCVDCHSKMDDMGGLIKGTEFGGGMVFKMPGGVLTTPNITADATGIGSWTNDQFITRFKTFASPNYTASRVAATEMNTPMPWSMYGGMKESDLEAIFIYLKQVPHINNTVILFKPVIN